MESRGWRCTRKNWRHIQDPHQECSRQTILCTIPFLHQWKCQHWCIEDQSFDRSRTRSSSCGIPPFDLLGYLKWILRPPSTKCRVFALCWITHNVDVSWPKIFRVPESNSITLIIVPRNFGISFEPLKSSEINMKEMPIIAFSLMLIFKPRDQIFHFILN